MIVEAIILLSSIEWTQDELEKKILEFDTAEANNNLDDLSRLRREILGYVKKLDRELANMDEFMLKYRRLIDEKKELLPSLVKERPIYLRGVPQNSVRKGKS